MTCSAYREKENICSNGFFQVLACSREVKCFTCGKPSDRIPHCMKDELPEHWITDDGKPFFYDSVTRPDRAGGSE